MKTPGSEGFKRLRSNPHNSCGHSNIARHYIVDFRRSWWRSMKAELQLLQWVNQTTKLDLITNSGHKEQLKRSQLMIMSILSVFSHILVVTLFVRLRVRKLCEEADCDGYLLVAKSWVSPMSETTPWQISTCSPLRKIKALRMLALKKFRRG